MPKTPATLDELAQMIQRGFAETANKKDLDHFVTKEEFHDFKKELIDRLDGIDLHVSSYASRWTEEFAKLHDWVKELDGRVKFLEKSKQ